VKNSDFITAAIAKYAVILGLAVFVSTRAEELASAAVDTASIQPSITPESTPLSIDTASTKSVSTPPAAHNINYTGVALSAIVPGSGQAYQSRYVMGGLFLAAEVTVAGFGVYWSDRAGFRRSEASRIRGISDSLYGQGWAAGNDSALLYNAGLYSVIADEADFEARAARHTAYNMLAWAVGLHLYNVLDALESGGLTERGLEKGPTTAGFLAAVPFLGLGQFYNERPSKAGMIAMAQIGLALTAYNQHRLMSIASDKYNQMRDSTSSQYAYRAEHLSYWKSRYDKSFSDRNTYLWLSLAAYLYSIFDAVVDAHLSDFNTKIDLGTDLSIAPNGGAVRVTVGLRKVK
jgi:TM2 domain-containing membrane protein YozV